MLGGGNFVMQNQVLPGAYINFVSAASAGSHLSERGVAAVPLQLSWGPEKEVFEVTAAQFQTRCQEIFGYPVEAPEMLPLRELFLNITKGIFYRLNTGTKAACEYAEAKYSGVRGNDLTVTVSVNVDESSHLDVVTLLDRQEVDRQTVQSAADLKDSGYLSFKKDVALETTAGIPLAGGTDGTVDGTAHADFLARMEPYSFHALACPSTEDSVKALYAAFTARMRDEAGVKFQVVLYRKNTADYEGVISIENKADGMETGLVYWATGAAAACAVNKTNENKVYNGELSIDTDYTQAQLADAVRSGKFMLHKAGSEVRVLMDINTLTTFTEEKGADFSNNQTVRVLDQMGNDIATLFNTRYLGTVPNDDAGRVSLWNDIVTYNKSLERIRAIEEVTPKDIVIAPGETKRSVMVTNPVTPINCMSQLYMTIIVQ